MEENDQRTCANLRLLSMIKRNQYIRTDRKYDVTGIVDDTSFNAFMAAIWLDSWNSTKYSLRKIFTIDIPALNAKLMKANKFNELKNLRSLLYKSTEGLCNLKTVYRNDELAIANIDAIMIEYISIQICDIEAFLTENDQKYKVFDLSKKPDMSISKLNITTKDI